MRVFQRRIILLAILAFMFVGSELFSQAKQNSQPKQQPASASRALWTGFSSVELLRQLDADQDGTISRDEWDSFFKQRDVNADGRLSLDELQSLVRKADDDSLGADAGRLAAFERLDANKNGVIDRSEWPGKKKDFRMLDADHDGSLSREEFLARAGRWWNEPFENLDFNRDKVISRSEWLDSEASFNKLDHDHNGVIDHKEFYNPR